MKICQAQIVSGQWGWPSNSVISKNNEKKRREKERGVDFLSMKRLLKVKRKNKRD